MSIYVDEVKYDYMAKDKDDTTYLYTDEPDINMDHGIWDWKEGEVLEIILKDSWAETLAGKDFVVWGWKKDRALELAESWDESLIKL